MNNEDAISRAAAKSKKVYSEERHEYVVPVAELDWLPSVPSQVHGRWEFVNDYESRCSVCGAEAAMDHENEYPNCPYCTAKMDGGVDDAN